MTHSWISDYTKPRHTSFLHPHTSFLHPHTSSYTLTPHSHTLTPRLVMHNISRDIMMTKLLYSTINSAHPNFTTTTTKMTRDNKQDMKLIRDKLVVSWEGRNRQCDLYRND
ncbi:hypothetical protein Pcinc_040842 [Petrolisthes cinctipes]|uniref:Uncharacterized protein n=1 Tax=Petrolisthes cinctipes TaxID=88211 RepID=A0AAE1BLE5_PETCI|nr:hypothetical protein Pcinc_040842 [Petrolisthes cinctipes]